MWFKGSRGWSRWQEIENISLKCFVKSGCNDMRYASDKGRKQAQWLKKKRENMPDRVKGLKWVRIKAVKSHHHHANHEPFPQRVTFVK